MIITIKNLNKIYPNGNHALKDVNLEIPTGMFGLLGPNGAGKSTLMRILVALMEPTSGQVEICGYDLMKQRKEIRGILGYLPQDFRFFAKYQQIILGKTDVSIALFRFRCQKIKMMSLIFFLDFRKIFMYLYIDQWPVIESGPFQIFIFKGKAQRFDKVQGNMIGRTETGNIPRIAWNFRFYHDYMHRYITLHGILYKISPGSTRDFPFSPVFYYNRT